jgi:heptosyltransferase-2
MAGFFARNGSLAPQLCDFFSGYQQVVSWLFDPDGIFEANLRRAGVKHYLSAYAKIADDAHAAAQLARGLEKVALYLDAPPEARVVPSAGLQREADAWLAQHGVDSDFAAIHPGSGSPRKNWPLENWQNFAKRAPQGKLIVISGEADEHVQGAFPDHALAHNLPLPLLSAILARASAYFGHDTGISHLAAAAGAPCTLLFGPTAPSVWAPLGGNVRLLEAPGGDLAALPAGAIQFPC